MWFARTRARHTHICLSVVSLGVQVVVSSGSVCVGNELPCARINTVRSLTQIRFRGTHFMSTLMALGCSWRGARPRAGPGGARADTPLRRPRDRIEIALRPLRAAHTPHVRRRESVLWRDPDRTRTCAHESSYTWTRLVRTVENLSLCVLSHVSPMCINDKPQTNCYFFARKRRTVYNARTTYNAR